MAFEGSVIEHLLAGRSAAVWAPEVDSSWRRGATAAALVRAALDDLKARGFLIAQALLDESVAAGEVVLVDGEPVHALFVLVDGSLRIEKAGVLVAQVSEPGACVGEMSLLLGVPATADVVVNEPTVVAVVDG